MKTVNNLLIVIMFVLTSTLHFNILAQNNNDYFTLRKGGKKFLRPIKYVLLNTTDKQEKNIDNIVFYAGTQKFIHKPIEHVMDTCPKSYFSSLKLSSVNQLFEEEKNEFNRAKKHEQFHDAVPPLEHYILKVFVIKAIGMEKFLFYEVEWENSIP